MGPSTAVPRHYWDDLEVGRVIPLGSTAVSAADIKAFALAFDPQPMHLDEDAARSTMIGELCASGFHSCAVMMRLVCDGFLLDAASLGSPGMEEVRWLKPVLPGRQLSGRFTTLSKRPLASRKGVGLAQMLFELVDEDGTVLMTWNTAQLLRTRPSEGTEA